jgi:hypothetical protein
MLIPRAFAIRDEVPLSDQLPGKCKGGLIQLNLIARLSRHRADHAEQNCNGDKRTAQNF